LVELIKIMDSNKTGYVLVNDILEFVYNTSKHEKVIFLFNTKLLVVVKSCINGYSKLY